jgi:hypothetical protein
MKGDRVRIERFEDIEAWQLARELTRKVYALTKKDKFARDFGLKGQIQDVYDHAGRTRATIRGFIKYLLAYDQSQRKKGNPEQ